MNADRNLLFGILALQLDFIDRDTLIEAINAWVLQKSSALGEVLVGQGSLTEDRRKLIEALVSEHLAAHEDDCAKSLASVDALGSLRDQLQQVDDSDVEASLAHVQSGSGSNSFVSTVMGEATSNGSRFHILRHHARGGLGEVSIAVDHELNREVALKEIQDRFSARPDIRERFVREAEITGGLEHPGIVPVYGLGHYDDGRPYYAMRFVRGDSLKRAISRFHESSSGLKRTDRELELRKLLRRLQDVCNAMHYAHSRGVLHRDLKPGNIMVGKYGETLVVDWGLATCQGVDGPETSEIPLQPPSASGSVATIDGSVLGTPTYMSPEQADGRLSELGRRSDVYSLGATLFTLLTGQKPFQGNFTDVLEDVRQGRFTPPRQLDGRVPPALNAICLKAMATKPSDRYESCVQLADEIEAWLADAPVHAYRNAFYRARLWLRRHRTAAVAGSLVLAAVISGVGLLHYRWSQLNDRIARHVARAELLVASSDMDGGLSELAVAAALSTEFAANATWESRIAKRQQQIDRFGSFLKKSRSARFYTTSNITIHSKDLEATSRDEFAELCREALGVYSVVEDPDWESQLDKQLFSNQQVEQIRDNVGELLVFLALRRAYGFKDDSESLKRTREALGYMDRAAKYIPAGPGMFSLRMFWHRRIGEDSLADVARDKVGESAKNQFGTDHVIDHYLLAQCTQNILKNPEDAIPMYRKLLNRRADHFRTHFALFTCYYETGDLEGQGRHLEACLALSPNDPTLFYMRGMSYFTQGKYQTAFEDFDASVAKDPDFATGYFYRGRMQVVFEKWPAAIADFSTAIDRDPSFYSPYSWRAIGHAKIGKHAEATSDAERSLQLKPDEDLAYYFASRAMAQAVAAVQTTKTDAEKSGRLADQYAQRSIEMLARGIELGFDDFTRLGPGSDFDPVRETPGFREVLKTGISTGIAARQKELAKTETPDAKQNLELGEMLLSLGELQSDAHEPDPQALDHFEQADRIFRSLLRDVKHRRQAATLLVRTLEHRAKLLDRLDRSQEADALWSQIALLRGSDRKNGITIDRAHALAESGNHSRSVELLKPLEAQIGSLSGQDFYNMACVFSLSVEAVHNDSDLNAEGRADLATKLTQRAIEMLQNANDKEFFDLPSNRIHFAADHDFDTVRQTPNFLKFAEQLKVDDQSEKDQSEVVTQQKTANN